MTNGHISGTNSLTLLSTVDHSNHVIELNFSLRKFTRRKAIEVTVPSLLNECDLSKLQVLDISDTKFAYKTLEILGNSCFSLRELRLQDCKGIDDNNVKVLVKIGTGGQCAVRHLKVLDMRDTRLQYIPRNMHTVFALLCFVVIIHWLIFPYPSGLLHWHCGNLTIAPVPAKQP